MGIPTVSAPRSPWRRRIIVLLAAGALLATLTAGTAITLQVRQPQADLAPTPAISCVGAPETLPDGVPTEAESDPGTAPDGGGLEVVETGFAQIGSMAAPITKGSTASLGAVVANTSGHIAYQTKVIFRLLDPEGESATLSTVRDQTREIPIILPGQEIGIGAGHWVKSRSGRRVEVARVEAVIEGTTWLPADTPQLTLITAHHLETQRYGPDGIDANVRYEIDSPYCQVLASAGASVLFRDKTGAIVGGGFDQTKSEQGCRPGESTQSALLLRSLPPGADDSMTEVYQYCSPTPDPSASPN
ncbi:hypothetical protein ACN27F_23915 [Solwaraspora sp. WMMB335]|uniref:hypothetical protein n=1 Tax=Solwaraspora sp. WMMB335 TaxID=3404118 RepID=UPI003B9464B7